MENNMIEKPVLFIDVDGVLLRFPESEPLEFWQQHPHGCPTPHVAEFLEWATTHFECRWLTSWAPWGIMNNESKERLAQVLDVPVELLTKLDHRHPWGDNKTQAIDISEFENGRTFRWLDDDVMKDEQEVLKRWGVSESFIHTNCSKNPNRLKEVWDELQFLIEQGDL